MNSYFSQPILPLIDATPEFVALLNSDIRKVGKYLACYARQLGQTAESLTLLDLCDERANLLPAFKQFINNRPQAPHQSEQQYVKYGSQILSRVKKIIKVIAAGLPNIQEIDSLPIDLLQSVPECLRPVLVYLPRANRRSAFSSARLASPITERGRQALKAILAVVEKN